MACYVDKIGVGKRSEIMSGPNLRPVHTGTLAANEDENSVISKKWVYIKLAIEFGFPSDEEKCSCIYIDLFSLPK